MKRQTILVIDDQKDFLDLVGRALEREGFDVILASNGLSGLKIASQHNCDLMVLDLTMPDIDGLQVCKRLRRDPRTHRLPILIMSARGSAPERVLGLDIGADDYLPKPFEIKELMARVHALLRRSVVSAESSAIVRSGDLEIDTARHVVSLANRPIPLTPVEFRILEYLAVNHDRVLSRDEIIESCLGEEATVMERTIDAHIAGIRRALGSAAQYVQTIRTIGYTFSTNQ